MKQCGHCNTSVSRPRFVGGKHKLSCRCGRVVLNDPAPLERRDIRVNDPAYVNA